MGYAHILNLYKDQSVLLFKEVYALEKVHGSSANISWAGVDVIYFSGGESQTSFKALFDNEALCTKFEALAAENITIFGEVYGGKCQKMSHTYGPDLKFIVFDIRIGNKWLSVIEADKLTQEFGLEFVPYVKISTSLEELDAERDRQSVVAIRRGCGENKVREGIVIKPLIEVTDCYGERIMAKHKAASLSECATPQKVVSPEKLEVLTEATAIAEQWVTITRMQHVLDKLTITGMQDTPKVIAAMLEDVYREGKGEFIDSKETKAALSKRAAQLFKAKITTIN